MIASAGSTEHVSLCPDLGPGCGTANPPTPYWHRVDQVTAESWLDVALGLTRWLAVEARLAVRVVDSTPTFRGLSGAPLSVDDPHHRDETLVGVPDPWLLLRFAGASGPFVASARVGVTLPLGKTEEDPYALGRLGMEHQHVQFGTGTIVPIVGAGLAARVGPLDLGASAIAFFSLYANDAGFRAPSRGLVGARVGWPLASGRVVPSASLDVLAEGVELWGGRPGEEANARADLLVGLGLAFVPVEPWQLDVGFRRRLVSLTDAAALRSPGWLSLSVGTHFDLGPKTKAAKGQDLDVVPR